MRAAAKEETFHPHAGLLAWLAQNSHPGHQLQNTTFRPGITLPISNTATSFHDPLYDFRGGPRCTGQYRDVETGNDWFNVRHMSGAQGRFQSPDPANAGAVATNPQSWNGYAYVVNNPLSYVDPTGLDYCTYNNGPGTNGVSAGSILGDNQITQQGCMNTGGNWVYQQYVNVTGNDDGTGGGGDVGFGGGGAGGGAMSGLTTGSSPGTQSIGQCMLANKDRFSLLGLANQLGLNIRSNLGTELALGNDVMGFVSALAGDSGDQFTTALGQSMEKGMKAGYGTPTLIGGPSGIQRLFPKVGRPPQVLVRSKLTGFLGGAADLFEGKAIIDLAFTAALFEACSR